MSLPPWPDTGCIGYVKGMLSNILLGTLLSALTVLVHALGVMVLTWMTSLIFEREPLQRQTFMKLVAVTVSASGVFVLLGVEIGLWAAAFLALGAFDDLETALYFSTSTFATIGFGDVAPASEWRLLASMQGVIGFLIVGWSSAYLVTSGIRFGPFERDKHF